MSAAVDPLTDLLTSERPIAYRSSFARATGSVTSAVLLSQFLYWSYNSATEARDGWFYKTMEEIYAETGLSRREQDSARKRLRDLGVLEDERRGIPPKVWFRIDRAKLFALLGKSLSSQDPASVDDTGGDAEEDTGAVSDGARTNQFGGFRQIDLAESANTDCSNPPNRFGGNRQHNTETTSSENTQETTTNQPAGQAGAGGGRGGGDDPDELTVDAFVSLTIRNANLGMRHNPAIGEHYNPLLTSSAPHRATVEEWLAAESAAPRAVILHVVYTGAKRFQPGDRRQVDRMSYFTRAIESAAARWWSGLTPIPAAPVPGTQAAVVLSDASNEKPGRRRVQYGERSTALEHISTSVDRQQIEAWKGSNPDEWDRLLRQESATLALDPNYAGKEETALFRARAKALAEQRVLSLLASPQEPAASQAAA